VHPLNTLKCVELPPLKTVVAPTPQTSVEKKDVKREDSSGVLTIAQMQSRPDAKDSDDPVMVMPWPTQLVNPITASADSCEMCAGALMSLQMQMVRTGIWKKYDKVLRRMWIQLADSYRKIANDTRQPMQSNAFKEDLKLLRTTTLAIIRSTWGDTRFA